QYPAPQVRHMRQVVRVIARDRPHQPTFLLGRLPEPSLPRTESESPATPQGGQVPGGDRRGTRIDDESHHQMAERKRGVNAPHASEEGSISKRSDGLWEGKLRIEYDSTPTMFEDGKRYLFTRD